MDYNDLLAEYYGMFATYEYGPFLKPFFPVMKATH